MDIIQGIYNDSIVTQVNEDGAQYVVESLFESDDFQSDIAMPVLGEAFYAFKSIAEGTK